MPDTRFSLIGKIVVLTVKAPDSILRSILKEMQQALKITKSVKKRKNMRQFSSKKRRKSSTAKRESKAEVKRRMERVRSFKN